MSSKLGLPYLLTPETPKIYLDSAQEEFFVRDLASLVIMLPGVTNLDSTWDFPRTHLIKNTAKSLPLLTQPPAGQPTDARDANVLDILQETYKSNSLTFVHAYNWETAHELNVHPDRYAPNHFGIYWHKLDGGRGTFAQLDIQWSLDLLSETDVWRTVSEPVSLGKLFPSFVGSFKFFQDHLFTVETAVGSATFDLNKEEEFAFFAEILSAVSSIKILTDNARSYSSLVRDKFPDAYVIVIENLQKIEESRRAVALELVKGMTQSLMVHLGTVYKQRASGLVVSTGTYTPSPKETSQNFERFRTTRTVFDEAPTASNETVYEDAGIFQICLWSTVALIIVVISIIYLLATIDVGKDTLLYRNSLDVQMAQQDLKYE
eukprot:TRINITY_DN556_c0_g1_i4.p1 TRINITY_DN556_c0_g1~~TRINITY_DN556_c0_g1_i4.p1  ORF type:complete len:376 (-),score=67.04 TRINITY_DN556_c0_g1_i4:98-1225(-)